MSNSIALAKKYTALLDEVYKLSALTNALESDGSLVRAGANANEIVVPKTSMDGLANYSRNSGYVSGDVDLTWETKQFNYDRGRAFSVDSMDDEETAGVAFGRLSSEFIRTKTVPEMDAFRFATYAAKATNSGSATFEDGEAVIAALRAATSKMDADEVPYEERYLFISPVVYGLVQDLDETKSRAVLSRFDKIIMVPQSRFYTAILQRTGAGDQAAGGYTKAEGAKDINFMIVHKPAVIQFQKHVAPKVITPEMNQSADAWKFGYRNVGIAEVYNNKVAGIFVHHKA